MSKRRPAQGAALTDDWQGQHNAILLLELRSPRRPACPLPRLPRRLVPDPGRSLEDWLRWQHYDVDRLSPADRRREVWRLRVAVALLDEPDDAPAWVLDRLNLLESAA